MTWRVVAVLACLCAGVTPALAQKLPTADIGLASSGGRGGAEEVRVAPAVNLTSNPPSFETVAITPPSGFPAGRRAEFTVRATGDLRVLGAMAGVLPAAGSVLLTFSVPRRFRAGTIEVARVRFAAPGATPVEVPVMVTIAPMVDIEITLPGPAPTVVRGERFTLRYRLANLGNRPESVVITEVLPPGWRVVGPERPTVSLAVNQLKDFDLEVEVPEGSATGSVPVRLVVSSDARPVAIVEALVTVLAEERTQGTGPLLVMGLLAGDGVFGSSRVASLNLSGQLTPGLAISGHLTTSAGLSGANSALARLGGYARPASLRLAARTWEVALGHSSTRFSDLAGDNLSGSGVAAAARGAGWRASALVAAPVRYGSGRDESGHLAGGSVEVSTGPVILHARGAVLEENGFDQRRLDVMSLGAVLPSIWKGGFSAEVASRSHASGSGLGYAARFDRRTSRDHLSVRLLHAPGGRMAFAQATDQLNFNASRELTGALAVHGSWWSSSDGATRSITALASEGWSAGTTVRLGRMMALGISGRGSRFETAMTAGRLASVEQSLEATLDLSSDAFYARSRGSIGTVRRETATGPGQAPLDERSNRFSADGSVGARSAAGLFSLNGRFERSAAGLGSLPMSSDIGIRGEDIPLLARGPVRLHAMGELRRLITPGFGPARTAAVASLAAEFPAGLSLAVAAERNPFLVSGHGASGWMYAVRVERVTRLPSLGREEVRGVVYHDLDSDGHRDEGEPGYAGAVIRHDGGAVVSGSDGQFRLPGSRAAGMLDPQSLARGWITGTARVEGGRQEIGVIPVAAVLVVLQLNDRDGLGIGSEVLAPIGVLARHESGRVWVARRTGADTARFEALPPGRYSVELDLLDAPVPLSAAGPLPAFTVGATGGSEPMLIELRPRPLRFGPSSPQTSPGQQP